MASLGRSHLSEVVGDLNRQQSIQVLHVDDEPDFADLVAVYLERESDRIEVMTEHSAETGLDRLESTEIDCVVSDYDMPGQDGLAFLEAVRECGSEVPFILYTGKGSEEIASEAISTGVTDYLEKGGGTDQYAVLANRIENVTQQFNVERQVERGFSAIETAREGIAFLDEEGTFQYVNAAYADVYGFDRDALIGNHWEMIYPEEHVEQVYEEILPSVPDQGRWTGESVHRRADGTRIIVDHALAYSEDGTLLCLIQDVTDRKEIQRELERERLHFERFVDAVEEYAIFSLDPDGFITSWNEGAKRLKGYDESDIVGRHFSTFYPDERVEEGYPEELLQRARDEGSVEDEGWRVREDGSRFWANVLITAVEDDAGHLQGFTKVTRDETAWEEAGRSEDDQHDLLFQAVDVLDDVFFMLDAEGNMATVSDRAVEITGYERSEILSMSPLELFRPDDRSRVRADITEALETGSARIEADVLTKDGETIPFEFRKRRLTDDDAVYVVGIGRDISERKRRERQFERQLAQFERFGSVLSHDLRTALDTAKERLELARDDDDAEHLAAAASALDRLDRLIDDLANVMREGELVDDVEAVALEPTLRSLWTTLPQSRASLEFETSGTIYADEDALLRLVENLFKNALEHAGPDVTVTVGMLQDGFYVEDDGPGIPRGERDRIFEPGYSTKGNGQGFGMASARQLAVAHGWEITALESADGGARFDITDVEVG